MNPVKTHHLALSDIRPRNNKASSVPSFDQTITHMGDYLFLDSSPKIMQGLTYIKTAIGHSIMVFIDSDLRKELDKIESWVKQQVHLPKELIPTWSTDQEKYYRPLYAKEWMAITLGRYCKFTNHQSKMSIPYAVDQPPQLLHGEYRIRIHVMKVYMGRHQNDKLFSIDLRVVGVEYTAINDMIVLDAYDDSDKENSYKPSDKTFVLQRQRPIIPKYL